MKEKRVILVTGGIGSGKSNITKAFGAFGIPAYDCDAAAKRLYDTDAELLSEVVRIAGEDVLSEGRINRKVLASKIFNDPKLLAEIESAVHPAVIRDFEKWKENCGSDICIIESAILLENRAFDNLYDIVVAVAAPLDERIERTMIRDKVSREEVLGRMSRQWSDEQREARADYIITTDDRHPVLPVILNIVDNLKNGKDRS